MHLGPLNLSSQNSDGKPPLKQHTRQQTPYFTQEPTVAGQIDLLQAVRNQNAKRKAGKNIDQTPIQLSDSVLKHLKNPTGQSDNSSVASFGANLTSSIDLRNTAKDPRFMLKSDLDVSSSDSEDPLTISGENQ